MARTVCGLEPRSGAQCKRAERLKPFVTDKHRTTSNGSSATLLTVVIVVAVLYFARIVLIPLALAVLLAFLLAPLVIRLRYWRLGRTPATLIVVHLAVAIIAAFGLILASQLSDLGRKMPE